VVSYAPRGKQKAELAHIQAHTVCCEDLTDDVLRRQMAAHTVARRAQYRVADSRIYLVRRQTRRRLGGSALFSIVRLYLLGL
jgi:hypothetical protein